MKTFEILFSQTACGSELIEASSLEEAIEIYNSGKHKYGEMKGEVVNSDTHTKPKCDLISIEMRNDLR